MNANEFTFWLNGFVEINDGFPPNEKQWAVIKERLNSVFNKVTPKREAATWPQPILGVYPQLVEFKPEFKDGVLQNAERVPVLDCAELKSPAEEFLSLGNYDVQLLSC